MGGLVGAVVAALVASGVTLALRDDSPTGSSRPAAVTPVTTKSGALDIQGILAKVQPSVVAIETSQTTARGMFQGAGTGIVLTKDGLVLTNAHVIGNLGEITVVLADGTQHKASLVGASPDDDLAVIKAAGVSDLVPAELGSSDQLRVGDEVIAIGNALNLGGEPTVTRGIVSAKDRDLNAEGVSLEGLIQTDAAINPGNSGGPLVNAAGQVVGMNTAIVADAQNLGFSIAIDRAKPIIKELESGKGSVTPDQAFLGVSSTDVDGLTDAVRNRFSIDRDNGAFVTEVVPASAASKAGIEVGDLIIEIDGSAVRTSSDVRSVVTKHKPGDKVTLRIVRDGDERDIEVTLGQRGA
jgi:putative serine protease PepD